MEGYYSPKVKKFSTLLDAVLVKALEIKTKDQLFARPRLVVDDDLPFYVVIKTKPECLDEFDLLANELKYLFREDTIVHLNTNNLIILSSFLNKTSSVSNYLKTYVPYKRQNYCLIGFGISLSDQNFLDLGDYQMISSVSQLRRGK